MSSVIDPKAKPSGSSTATEHRADLSACGTTFKSHPLGGRVYITPDSSVSPGLLPKDMGKRHDHSPVSGDETDDLFMDGIDDGESRVKQSFPDAGGAADSPYLDATGARLSEDPAVAPSTLADIYLPALFAQHGPCAIRHLTQYLAVNNPKFGALAPGRQRRLVVKALELKKGVLFEKVGWGRWNQVEPKGVTPGLFTPESMPQTFDRSNSLMGSSVKQSVSMHAVAHLKRPAIGSYPAASSYTSQHEFLFSPSLSVADPLREDEDDADIDPLDLDMDDGDSETDEEDWKSLGVNGLRARQSQQGSAAGSYAGSYRDSMGLSLSHRTSPYPMRRKSSAGVYQVNSPHLTAASFSKSPSFSRPSFPKTSSYLKASPMSNARASSFSSAREIKVPEQISPTRGPIEVRPKKEDRGAQAEAVEALVMLATSFDDRRA